jgi:flagellar protein FliO/FliZ
VPKRGEPDPFSVEDIEAEFARLLGRPTDRT